MKGRRHYCQTGVTVSPLPYYPPPPPERIGPTVELREPAGL